jgi:hypothetical protein
MHAICGVYLHRKRPCRRSRSRSRRRRIFSCGGVVDKRPVVSKVRHTPSHPIIPSHTNPVRRLGKEGAVAGGWWAKRYRYIGKYRDCGRWRLCPVKELDAGGREKKQLRLRTLKRSDDDDAGGPSRRHPPTEVLYRRDGPVEPHARDKEQYHGSFMHLGATTVINTKIYRYGYVCLNSIMPPHLTKTEASDLVRHKRVAKKGDSSEFNCNYVIL